MIFAHRLARLWLFGLGAVLIAVLSLAPVAAARADGPPVSFTEPAVVIEYGQHWSFTAVAKETWVVIGPWSGSSSFSGGPSGYVPSTNFVYDRQAYTTTVWISPQPGVRPLPAGKYTINATVTNQYEDSTGDTTGAPATLTVNPAALGIEVRATDDPSNKENAILTARFTGEFLNDMVPTGYDDAPLKPAGRWTLVVKDEAGTVVEQFESERLSTDESMATSFYWEGPSRGSTYSVSASFSPTSESARNFAVTNGPDFNYTVSAVEREVPTSSASAQAQEEALPKPDFSVPLWWILLIGATLATLIAFTVIFAIRWGRSGARMRSRDA